MTEEIIIDGVNIAGCPDLKHYNDAEGNMMCMEYIDGSCEGHNCFFKQLKRLEQENKELKEEIQFHNKENSNLLAERNALQIGYDEIREIRERYRSALEEIREIAEFNQFYNPEDLLINGDIGQIQDLKMTEIYNKINEVLDKG